MTFKTLVYTIINFLYFNTLSSQSILNTTGQISTLITDKDLWPAYTAGATFAPKMEIGSSELQILDLGPDQPWCLWISIDAAGGPTWIAAPNLPAYTDPYDPSRTRQLLPLSPVLQPLFSGFGPTAYLQIRYELEGLNHGNALNEFQHTLTFEIQLEGCPR
jgi:hypothetical protein